MNMSNTSLGCYQLKEKGGLIGLQCGLRIDWCDSPVNVILGCKGGCRRELLDEL